MAKTYGELILEYENFAHSKEHFEMMKECYEIELMTQYAESQQFMVENMAEIREQYTEFDESYFIEATDEETAKDVASAAASKKEGFLKKAWNKIMEALRNVGRFFVRIFENLRRRAANLDKFEAKYKGKIKSIDEMGEEKLASAIKNAWPQKYIDDGYEISAPSNADVDPDWNVLINGIKDKNTKNKLKAAFSKNAVSVKLLPKNGTNKYPEVIDAKKFSETMNTFSFGRDNSQTVSDGTENRYISRLETMINKDIAKGSITLDLSDTTIKEVTERLKQVEQKLKGMAETEGQAVTNYNGPAAMKLYNRLLVVCANTMSMYNYVYNYRKDILIALTKPFNELMGAGKKEEDPKSEPKSEPKAEE